MSARDDILGRIRARLGRNATNRERGQLNLGATLAAVRRGPQPGFPRTREALLQRFVSQSEALASTTERVAERGAVPAAVAAYLGRAGLGREAVVWRQLADLDWAAAGLRAAVRPTTGADLVGITGAFCAVAETGTLLLASSPDTPAATSLLPETHIAVIDAELVLATMEDAFDRVRAELGRLPRALNFVSGPSRTADIEQTLVIGAHGPYRVHLIVVG